MGAVEAALAAERPSYAELYKLAKQHDLRGPEGARPEGTGDYVVFAFYKDLLAPDAGIQMDMARLAPGLPARRLAYPLSVRGRLRPGGEAEDREWRRLKVIFNR